MTTSRRRLLSLAAALLTFAALAVAPTAGRTAERDSFRVAWSIYVGWMPWGYAADTGIMKRWADKYGIKVEVVQINDYVESINQYTAGAYDGCVMTNMDALTIPAAGGVDTTALIIGDFSNGNDGIVAKTAKSVAALKGGRINLVELSVSHYLLARALAEAGLAERDVTLVNTSDADIVSAFTGSADVKTVVTWNPQLAEVAKVPGATKIFDSSRIPGEIIDLMVVNTETLKANPKLGKALVGAWYEVMALMGADSDAGRAARSAMAKASGTDLAGFEAQLKTTRMFYRPAEAVAFAHSPDLVKTMEKVRTFSFSHGLLGQGAKSADVVGIAFPDSPVLGDKNNVRLRFVIDDMERAAAGTL